MRLSIRWQDKVTGRTGTYQDDFDYVGAGDDSPLYGELPFLYGEGNWSCDCNRSLIFMGIDDYATYNCGSRNIEITGWEWK